MKRTFPLFLLPALAACSDVNWQSVLHPAGNDAEVIVEIAWVLFGGGTLIFVGVMIMLAMSLRHGRPHVRPAVWLIGAGVVFPVTVLSALLLYSIHRSQQLLAPVSHDALVVSVTAKMWWWEVRYRDPVTGRDIVTANEIRLPANKPVYLALTSDDVIHSFWVPALAGKVDMLPGRLTRLRVKTGAPGIYRGQCAEYCGEQHAKMALHVVVEEAPAFDAWLSNQAQPARATNDPLLAAGRQVFLTQRCAACHTIRGVADENLIGGQTLAPDLTHIGSRLYLGAGILRNEGENMRDWIAQTQRFKHGARMPGFADMPDHELDALARYLESLQ
ncbi:cytochrome c oxidase subunit II [Oxalicibacterium faecigallinarum]|uniref:cytochrome c oxidase subunit II n=1 Tax=Oxalicibacterium faecigallinarum TaxID=573741 RepID=UPI00280A6816|nr:c-type cytochrome [Oxalicibacterium faecigallinarum]